MSIPRQRRQTIKRLVTEGLHYCCLWAFFKRNWRRTQVIADRLGCSTSAIRYAKASFKAGELKCENCKNCLKGRLV